MREKEGREWRRRGKEEKGRTVREGRKRERDS